MEFILEDWHWLIFGILLVTAEVFIPSFTILWFGLGAIIVAIVLWFSPDISISTQLFLWTVSSIVFVVLWFKYFKPTMIDRTKAGIAKEAILGESGTVIKAPTQERLGVVRFSTPILGSDEWPFRCENEVEIGDRVFISGVSGNTLKVRT